MPRKARSSGISSRTKYRTTGEGVSASSSASRSSRAISTCASASLRRNSSLSADRRVSSARTSFDRSTNRVGKALRSPLFCTA